MKTIEHNIGVREAVAAGVIFTTAKLFLGTERVLAQFGATAAWLVALLSMTHGPVMFWALSALLKRYPGKSLIAATEAVLGPILGTAVNLLYAAYFAGVFTVVMREFADSIVLVFLPRTPLPVIVALLLVAALYAAYLGFEPIARTSWLGGPWMLIGYVILAAAGLMTHMEPNALFPIWGNGPLNVISSGLSYNLLGELLLFGIVAPSFRDAKQWSRSFWITILFVSLLFVGTEATFQMIFPYPSAAEIVSPLMQVSRTISLGPGIQRVEGFFFLIWGSGGMLKMAIALFASANTLGQTLRLPSYRHLLFPLAILVFFLALIPRNLSISASWDVGLRLYGGQITVLLPVLTALIAWMLRKGGEVACRGLNGPSAGP